MAGYKILIVDDVIDNLHTIVRFLEESHREYRLYQVTSGSAALELSKANPFDLIIADWNMPEMTGIDLIRILKANPRTMHIPVVVVTGMMIGSEDMKIAMAEGAHDYLRKPIDPIELSARVSSALKIASCHAREIENKNLELGEKALNLIKYNNFNIDLVRQLKRLLINLSDHSEAREVICKIINEIDQKIKEDGWEHFEIAFQNVHTEFIRNLTSKYPCLTPGELKLSILIKLGMNIKDMASLLYQGPDSIKVARSRLRQKLQISNKINFQIFLSAF